MVADLATSSGDSTSLGPAIVPGGLLCDRTWRVTLQPLIGLGQGANARRRMKNGYQLPDGYWRLSR